MQLYLSSAIVRHDGNAFFRLPADARFCGRLSRMVLNSPLHGGPSASRLRGSHGSLMLGLPKDRPSSCSPLKRPLKAAASSSRSSATEDVHNEGEVAKKVIRTVLSVALAVGLATIARSGSAIASTQLAFPGASSGSIAARSGRELLVSAWMGLMAGCLHTLTGPDHLAALAPLSIGRTKLESVAVGALWGCGHDAGQVIFGILFLLLKDKLQIEVLRTWGARVVGMTLVTIGVVGVKEAQEAAVPYLAGNGSSLTPNMLPPSESFNGTKKNIGFATFATGIVHGLQPDALIMILPALALPSRFAGAAFLSMFLFGTVIAMSSYTVFIGSCSHALKKRVPRITEHLSWGSSLVAIFVGVAILTGELFGSSIF